jgi:rhodanese-related sulfurtransferase
MHAINPNRGIVGTKCALSSENALDILRDYDIVVDGTDNFPTRYLVNDACVSCWQSRTSTDRIFRFEGQATVFAYQGGPCYRCLYPEPPPPGLVPSCAEGGVLGILPGTIGLIQATETVKLILGIRRAAGGPPVAVRRAGHAFPRAEAAQEPRVPGCAASLRPSPSLIDYHQFCGVPQTQETKMTESEIEVTEVKAKLDRGDHFVLIDVREPHEYKICHIPAAKLIPLGELPKRLNELDPQADIVIHCKSGMRSAKACGILRQAGFQHVRNMKGGILAWADKVDPSVPK